MPPTPLQITSSLAAVSGMMEEDNSNSSSSASASALVNKIVPVSSINTHSDATSDQDGSSNSRHYFNESGGSKSSKVVFAQHETRQVRTLRFMVGFVLLTVTILLSVGVYVYSHHFERNEFETSFMDKAEKIVSSFQNNVAQRLQTMNTFAITTITHSHAMKETWPFVEIPNMEIQGSNMRKIAQVASMVLGMVVSEDNHDAWINFTLAHEDWVSESLEVQRKMQREKHGITKENVIDTETTVAPFIPAIHLGPQEIIPPGSGPYMPAWQQSPAVNDTIWVNYDLLHGPNTSVYSAAPAATTATHQATVSEFLNYGQGKVMWDWVLSAFFQHVDPPPYMGDVFSYWIYPLMEDSDDETQPPTHVASFLAFAHWSPALSNVLSAETRGIICVLENTHGQKISYRLDGATALYLGPHDLHDATYDDLMVSTTINTFIESSILGQGYDGVPLDTDYCDYKLYIYPSTDFYDDYITKKPLVYALAVAFCFCFTTVIFVVYDSLVERRYNVVQKTAVQTSAIVTSLFPENVRDRLLQDEEEHANDRKQQGFVSNATGQRLNSFAESDCGRNNSLSGHPSPISSLLPSVPLHKTKPIADLFPHATVLFADISGFTAWSSVRDPTEVFALLETVYGAFDSLAKRRGVFKVETIGDSYLAVTGLPRPQEHHAVIMTRFARDCMVAFDRLVHGLEINLGPGTSNLAIRIGIHSGPVTAGVLRGDKSRFQLFGDTVNTASRMESTGERKQIQISTATADLLTQDGKGHWFSARETLVAAKGKGMVQTYWLHLHPHSLTHRGNLTGDGVDTVSTSVVDSDEMEGHDEEFGSPGNDINHQERVMVDLKRDLEIQALVEWNTQLLSGHLREVVSRRRAMYGGPGSKSLTNDSARGLDKLERDIGSQTTPLEETTQVIVLPQFDSKVARKQGDPSNISLDDKVVVQLREYITRLASLYRDNPFHNFLHASHVAKSVSKLLSRVVAPDDSKIHEESQTHKRKEKIHDHTYGIASSPLSHFAIVLSALIHDVDHRGIPNGQLIVEAPTLAERYDNRSVAEQNSVDVAWELLMDPSFALLRRTIYTTHEELRHFRQVIVNAVVATDIFDKELQGQRTERWKKAFGEQQDNMVVFGHNDEKASIVIEHLIQASDVIHTMQHWLVYQKWNAHLFREMHEAFQTGHAAKDPSEGWYGGELWFFDNYVIPLARRLKDCGVFGVSSEECLNYALENRSEWEMRGKEIVAELVQSMSSSIEEGH